jgi:hypothetical protein
MRVTSRCSKHRTVLAGVTRVVVRCSKHRTDVMRVAGQQAQGRYYESHRALQHTGQVLQTSLNDRQLCLNDVQSTVQHIYARRACEALLFVVWDLT